MPYIGIRTTKFIKIFKQYNIYTGIKNDFPLLNKISYNKMKIKDKNNVSVAYKLNCEQCNMTCVEKTDRKFSTRL